MLELGEVGDLCLIPLELRFAPPMFDYNHSKLFTFRFVYREWFIAPELAGNIPILDLKCYESIEMVTGGEYVESISSSIMMRGYNLYWKNMGKVCCSLSWERDDRIYEIPQMTQVYELSDIFWQALKNQTLKTVEMPRMALLGTLMDVRYVSHSKTEYPHIGIEECSRYNLVWFRDRAPMWVYGDVWKCPEDLVELPIYLPSV